MKKDFLHILKEADLKATLPRLAVLGVLADFHEPKNVQDIHTKLSKKGIDIVTVYRTLTSFEKAGLVRRVDLRKDAVFYELADEHHHHIVCTNCGDVEDFELCDIESLTKKITVKAKKFKTINQHSFELFGVCTACAC